MKRERFLLVASLALLLLSAVGVFAQDQYVPKPNEELYGIWINGGSPKRFFYYQELVIAPSGFEIYSRLSDSAPVDEGTEGIDSKWTDSEGNLWYKWYYTVTTAAGKGRKVQELAKLSDSGAILETVDTFVVGEFDPKSYPAKIDPKETTYALYHRAEEAVTIADAIKAFAGTWVNPKMPGLKMRAQKYVINPDGSGECWLSTAYPTWRSVFALVAAWKGSDGCLYCTVDEQTVSESSSQVLWKLNQSGNTLERNAKMTKGEEYPTKIDQAPDPAKFPQIYYGIWYRQ